MKRTQWQFMLTLLVMLLAFNMNMTAAKRLVQRGMNKQEVIQILGKPHSTSFNPYGEQWEYLKSSLLDYDHKILISFDRNDRVISYQDIPLRPGDNTPQPILPTPQIPYGGYPDMGRGYPDYPYMGYSMNERDFSVLHKKVKEAGFDDNKLALVEVATLGCYYTCDQCAKIINMFSFSDNQIKALKLMAHHIVDPENAYTIYRIFTFSSDKDKAARILQRQRY